MAVEQRNIKSGFNLVGVAASAAAFLKAVRISTAVKGMVYFDTTINTLMAYNGSTWTTLGDVADVTGLDSAAAINATAARAITIKIDDSVNTVCLTLDQDDTTNNTDVLTIQNAGTGKGIDFQGQAGGKDIEGTGDKWQVTGGGIASFEGIAMADSKELVLGGGTDMKLYSDGTRGVLTGALHVGVDGTGADVTFFGDTSGDYILWDQDGNTNGTLVFEDCPAIFMDNTYALFGDGATLGGDFRIGSDGAILHIQEVAAAGKEVRLGADDKGLDVTFFAETAGDYMKWDQNGASNLGALIFEDSALQFAGANSSYSYAISTDSMLLTATDHANSKLILGTAGTNGMDVVFQSATAGDNITFDAADKSLTFEDCTLKLNDGDSITLGASSALILSGTTTVTTGTIVTNGNLLLRQDGNNAGTITLGATGTHGTDVVLQSVESGDHITFDAGAKTLTFADCNLVMGEEFIQFHDSAVKVLSSADGKLDIDADGEVEITTALLDVTATATTVSGTLAVTGATTLTAAVTATAGVQSAAVERTAMADGGAASVIAPGTRIVSVIGVTTNANDWVLLPAAVIGNKITIFAAATSNFELRTPATSNNTINNIDSDGDQEYLVTDTDTVELTCTKANTWIAVSYTNLGAVRTAVVPD